MSASSGSTEAINIPFKVTISEGRVKATFFPFFLIPGDFDPNHTDFFVISAGLKLHICTIACS